MSQSPINNLGSMPLAIGIEGVYDSKPCRITRRVRYQGYWVHKYQNTYGEGNKNEVQDTYQDWDMWEVRLTNQEAYFYIRQTSKSYELLMPTELIETPSTNYGRRALYFNSNSEIEYHLQLLYQKYQDAAVGWGKPQVIEPTEDIEPTALIRFSEVGGWYLEANENPTPAPTAYYKYKSSPSTIRGIFGQHSAFRHFKQRLGNVRLSANIAWVSVLVLFFSWLFLSPKGNKVFEHIFEAPLSTETRDSAAIFTLPKGVYIAEIKCYIQPPPSVYNYANEVDAEVWVELYDDEEGIMVQEFGGDFWYASGYSEGEKWLDTQTLQTSYWYNDQETDFAADIYVSSPQNAGDARITLAIYKAGFMGNYLWAAFVIIIIIGGILELVYWSDRARV